MAKDTIAKLIGIALIVATGFGFYHFSKTGQIKIFPEASAGDTASSGTSVNTPQEIITPEPVPSIAPKPSSSSMSSAAITTLSAGGQPIFNAHGEVAVFNSSGQGTLIDKSSGTPVGSVRIENFKPIGSSGVTSAPMSTPSSVTQKSSQSSSVVSRGVDVAKSATSLVANPVKAVKGILKAVTRK